MNKNLTDITLVIDRSGSMQSMKSDAEGGIRSFIENQAKQAGQAVLSLVQFDDVAETVHEAVGIENVPIYNLVPRGSTALLDAIGDAITNTGKRLAAMPEATRPGLVVFVIVTDGEENASRRFTRTKINEMIRAQTDIYKWEFVFLAANQDAFAEAGSLGIKIGTTSNYKPGKVGETFSYTADTVTQMRSNVAAGMTAASVSFTKEQQEDMDS